MISFENISVRFSGKTVVQGVSGKANAGEFIALVGPNGSGKSSLLRALTGLIPHDGSTSLPPKARDRAKSISYLGQNCTAPSPRQVDDILALGRTPFLGTLSRLNSADREAINDAAELCEISDLLQREFGTLSGGEKMRVHLARTLATQAPILVADEPIAALDPYYQISVMNTLRKTSDAGTLVIAALHDLNLARRFCDRIWVIQDGRLVMNDTPAKALASNILRDVFRITADGEIVQ